MMENTFQPKNEKEAWIGILFSCMSSDKRLPEHETETLAHLLLIKEMFKSSEVLLIYRNAMLAHSKLGDTGLIDICLPLVSDENKATLFALASDLILTDGVIHQAESTILEHISSGLKIPADLKEKILEVISIKNRGNKTFF